MRRRPPSLRKDSPTSPGGTRSTGRTGKRSASAGVRSGLSTNAATGHFPRSSAGSCTAAGPCRTDWTGVPRPSPSGTPGCPPAPGPGTSWRIAASPASPATPVDVGFYPIVNGTTTSADRRATLARTGSVARAYAPGTGPCSDARSVPASRTRWSDCDRTRNHPAPGTADGHAGAVSRRRPSPTPARRPGWTAPTGSPEAATDRWQTP